MTQQTLSIGQCIRLCQDVPLHQDVPHLDGFMAKVGMTGVIISLEKGSITARMDQPLSEKPSIQTIIEVVYGNCIQWSPDTFREDCEIIDCSPASA